MRGLVVSAALVVSCREPAAVAPEPAPAKTELTPEQMCNKVSAFSKEKVSDAARAGCIEKTSAMKHDDPRLYSCVSGCLEQAPNEDGAEKCIEACLPPKEKKKLDAENEALRVLGSIETGSKNKFQQESDTSDNGIGPWVHQFCPSTKEPLPRELPPAGESASVTWEAPTWNCLKVSFDDPLFNQYTYENNGKTGPDARYIATARRRLENGKQHVITLTGKGSVTGDAERVSLVTRDE